MVSISSLLFADVPHIVKDNEIVDAKRLNENFKYLSDKDPQNDIDISNDIKNMDQNIADNTMEINSLILTGKKLSPVYSNGKLVGYGSIEVNNLKSPESSKNGYIAIFFNKDFDVSVLKIDGRLNNYCDYGFVYFTQLDCQGQPYADSKIQENYDFSSGNLFIGDPKGKIFDNGGELYYYEKYADLHCLDRISIKYTQFNETTGQYDTICENNNPVANCLIELKPNDPTITGIQNEDYPFTNLSFAGFNF